MEKSLAEQEREIKDVIRRAKGNPDRTGTFRRETLKRLIDLTHSPHPTLKMLAAANIRTFFNDFPELEELAINAVYDLCEDQSAKVRIEGYDAITQVSVADNRWVKRNADVLVQLLQSDEPDEVVVVKKALAKHLDMEPRVTLGVLCDQIVPPFEPMDDEEQSIRDRLRSLVLAFLTGEAKRSIVERHAAPASSAEDVLINGLLGAIPKLGFTDIEIIVKDLLLSLKAYEQASPRGQALLAVILDKATMSTRIDLRPGISASLETTRPFLGLAAFLVVEKKMCPPTDLLTFYLHSLARKMTLQRLSPEDQCMVVYNIAETLDVMDNVAKAQDVALLKRQVVDACPYMLEPLCKAGLTHSRLASACKILVRCCKQRRDETSWTVPPHLTAVLEKLEPKTGSEQIQEVQNLIRSLAPHTSNLLSQASEAPGGSHAVKNASQPIRPIRANGQHASLPDRPLTNDLPPRRMVIASKHRRDAIMADPPPHGETSILKASNHQASADDSPRPAKRRKEDEVEPMNYSGLSLLRRLGDATSEPPRPKSYNAVHPSLSSPDVQDNLPQGGYSIKGAAAKIASTTESSIPQRPVPVTFSLLDRLEGGGGSPADSSGMQNRKKKKGRVQ